MSINLWLKHQESLKIASKAESFHGKRKILQHLSDSPLLLVNFDIFSARSRKNRRSERKSEAKKREKCWYPVSMDSPSKKKNFFVNSVMCGGAGGEFSHTIAHRARSLLVWMAKMPSASFSRWHREFSVDERMLECSAVSRRKLNLLTHMPENHEGADACLRRSAGVRQRRWAPSRSHISADGVSSINYSCLALLEKAKENR